MGLDILEDLVFYYMWCIFEEVEKYSVFVMIDMEDYK